MKFKESAFQRMTLSVINVNIIKFNTNFYLLKIRERERERERERFYGVKKCIKTQLRNTIIAQLNTKPTQSPPNEYINKSQPS